MKHSAAKRPAAYRPSARGALALLFLLLMALAPSGCTEREPAQPEETGPITLASHFEERYTDDLPKIIERRYIRVLTTFSRTNFFVSEGRAYGYEHSLLKEYEKFLNRKHRKRGLHVVMEFIPVSGDELITALAEGRGDIAASGLTVTPLRLEEASATRPYLKGVDELVVVHASVEGIGSPADLSGRSVYVRRSSSYYESLVELSRRFAHEGRRPVEIMEADETLSTEDILELVNSGAVGITVADSHMARLWSRVLADIRVLDGVKLREDGRLAFYVRKSNPELKKSLDSFIRTHRKGTRLGNILFSRYYDTTRWIKNPLAEEELEKQMRLRNIFRRYSKEYGFDWMLMMAVAYQESGLDNSRRSRSGAVGIMQVLPETASAMGIEDPGELERNIHAGIKYLAHLRDRYFDEPGLKEEERLRLTLAAYNAGPTKIRRARRRARRMRLDRDRWFRNVEIATLAIVGQETVRYVSNINKYYVLYRLNARDERRRERLKERVIGSPERTRDARGG